ncbi:hypothetical protein MGYG_02750 [Nannizzia gypsea CBS 118893]|uniref:Uncharacterized protein n=1 Tax=Arthroderma gypseum (strain ATCC MYA-4604 / CBS 118893) TaxID=535722 RepID=E4UNY4_ARTGP|nr:hypothetical protein MGYG_02750 [Nannizzia gypsea CBS 118893]EFQ99737.1 hypothetical protein MGYG_02750 [Nannizzia gypsea CBS 118893]
MQDIVLSFHHKDFDKSKSRLDRAIIDGEACCGWRGSSRGQESLSRISISLVRIWSVCWAESSGAVRETPLYLLRSVIELDVRAAYGARPRKPLEQLPKVFILSALSKSLGTVATGWVAATFSYLDTPWHGWRSPELRWSFG